MAFERGDRISDLYNRALERPPEERSAFLQDACDGDDALQQEVESLLRYESGAARFLEQPAADPRRLPRWQSARNRRSERRSAPASRYAFLYGHPVAILECTPYPVWTEFQESGPPLASRASNGKRRPK